jgi:hypothetical protein
MAAASHASQPLIGTFYRYHFIGNGAQFRVYAIHSATDQPTGRVIKVPLDFDETKHVVAAPLSRIATYNTVDEFNALLDARVREIMRYKHTLPGLIQGTYGQDQRFMRDLGELKMLQAPIPSELPNAYFLPIYYTQDQVTTIGRYLEHFRFVQPNYPNELAHSDITIVEKLVQEIIALHYAIWEYGFFEFVFKPENMGIRLGSSKTEVIWMDLAEHITDKEQAEAILAERRWQHSLLPHKIDYIYMPAILHDYYVKACDKAFTLQEFRKRWRRKCNTQEQRQQRRLHRKALFTKDPQRRVALWIAQQNVKYTLYHGLASDRIDDMNIPQHDLIMLYNDRQIAPRPPHENLEPIERDSAASPQPAIPAYEQLILKYQ